jgi:ADP-ribosylglycohydrolase
MEIQRLGERSLRWTDDTQMAASLVAVLESAGCVDQDRLAAAFANAYEPWRGYGAGMHRLLGALRDGGDWRQLAPALYRSGSCGNGAAMRVAPLGAFLVDEVAEKVVEQAQLAAEVTHCHPEGLAGSVAVALAAWLSARSRGDRPNCDELFDALARHLDDPSEVRDGVVRAAELSPDSALELAVKQLGNGSRVLCQDSVPLALWIAFSHIDDFRSGIETAVRAGGDTDTIAAMVGGILAARLGLEGVPLDWLAAVEPLPG